MLLRHAWTSSRPRPPERSSEPGGLEHGEAGVQGAGPGQTPKVGAGKHVGWDITRGCPPSLAGDEEHRALVMLAERVCDGFWQRWLIKIRGVAGSQMRQGPGRVSGLAGSLCFARHGQPFPKSTGGPGGGHTEVLAPMLVHAFLSCTVAQSSSTGSLPRQGWGTCCILATWQGWAQLLPTSHSHPERGPRS